VACRTVAGDNDKLVIVGNLVLDDIRVRGDNLCLGRDRVVLLVLKVTERAREGEVPVDAAKLDVPSSSDDAIALGCKRRREEAKMGRRWSRFAAQKTAERVLTLVLRFVVVAERLSLALDAEHTPRVACVCL
jgi:hypothetical protein